MENVNNKVLTVGEIVANDFRTASIFKESGIDFCCGGKQSIAEACQENGVEQSVLVGKIKELESSPLSPSQNFKEWELGFLSDYIVNTHHRYVSKALPELLFYTQKIATVHGEGHPELVVVAEMFAKINDELSQHLKKEEEVLFPAIKEALNNPSEKLSALIKSEIDRMEGEHDFAGGSMDEIKRITDGYRLPDDACNTYRLSFQLLEHFEDDLHVHVHLENNILYPKARHV